MGLNDRDYWREVPEYLRVTGRARPVGIQERPATVARPSEPKPRPLITFPDAEYDFWTQPVTVRRLRTPILVAVMLLALFVLPHFTLAGHHWRVWILP